MDKSIKKWNIGWGITEQCNMNCKFCYSKRARKDKSAIPISQCIQFVDNNHSYINSINYGTGENSILSEWFDLISHIRENYKEIKQALTTNGYIYHQIINNNSFYKIVANSIDEIDVSLDYAESDKHNEMRGNKNAYDWAINTLKFCKETNIKSTIVIVGLEDTLTKENLDGIFEIAQKNGAMVRINIYRPVNSEIQPPQAQKLYNMLNYLISKYEIASFSDPLFFSIFQEMGIKLDMSGHNSLRILPDGSITPSTYLTTKEWHAGNISDSDILCRIGETEVFKSINTEILPDLCKSCDLSNRCMGGAKDRRILYYGTLSQTDPYCPFREENNIDISTFKKIDYIESDLVSIHDGYLPTLIFKNSEK